MSFMLISILTLAFYLVFFFSALHYTLITINEKINYWVAAPNTDVTIEYKEDDKLQNYLANHDDVDTYFFGNMTSSNLPISSDQIDTYNLTYYFQSTYDTKLTKVNYEDGRPPQNANEIGITLGLAEKENLKIGEYLNLSVNGISKDYLIVGTLATFQSGGISIQILFDVLDEVDFAYDVNYTYVNLRDNTNVEAFIRDINRDLGICKAYDLLPTYADSMTSIEESITPITSTLIIVFIVFSLFNVANALIMYNLDNKRKYGIMKSLGFTNTYILKQNICKILILTLIALLLAGFLNMCVSPMLFKAMLGGIDGLSNPPQILLLISAGLIVLISIMVIVFNIENKKITPVELMEE